MSTILRTRLLVGTAVGTALLSPAVALAQAATDDSGGLSEIVVMAQKREQSVQDVPIAVTALSEDTLKANRVVSVNDLSGLAPGVQVRPSAGGSQIPTFTMRGVTSFGVVPGSDKQVSIYLDGVYISSPRGSIFDLPDVQQLEVLRGLQGTLFGRNSTAGAISVRTRDPNGEFGIHADLTVGNYAQKRMRLSVSTPEFGPFSAYATYVHNQRHGDIRNAQAGQVWDRTATPGYGIDTSPKYLGSTKSDAIFAAVKFEPSSSFKTVYKFDYVKDMRSAEGTALLGVNPNSPATALTGGLVAALINSQSYPALIASNGKRPKVVNNGWTVTSPQKVFGHSLTSTWQASDNLTVKNIMSYRKTNIFATSPIDGFSGATLTQQALVPYATFVAISSAGLPPSSSPNFPAAYAAALASIPGYVTQFAPLVGSPFVVVATQPLAISKQWSEELQVNYESDLLTLTGGALWFKGKDLAGGPINMQNTLSFTPVPGGILRLTNQGEYRNTGKSTALYGQAEVHVTPQLDIVGGLRYSWDRKSGSFAYGSTPNLTTVNFKYKDSRPTYLVGVNFKPTDKTLVYAKYSTGYVSGGSATGIAYAPETVKSWEGGVKTSVLDNHLQMNLAVFSAKYDNIQLPQGSAGLPDLIRGLLVNVYPSNTIEQLIRSIGTFVLSAGGMKAKGVEFDFTAAPARGFTAGGSLGYTDHKFTSLPAVLITANGGDYAGTLRPKWTAGLWGAYQTPVSGDTNLVVRVDGNWRSKQLLDNNRIRNNMFTPYKYQKAYWIVNGRMALTDVPMGGLKGEVALWSKNMFNSKARTFELINANFEASANYVPARTFGLDLSLDF